MTVAKHSSSFSSFAFSLSLVISCTFTLSFTFFCRLLTCNRSLTTASFPFLFHKMARFFDQYFAFKASALYRSFFGRFCVLPQVLAPVFYLRRKGFVMHLLNGREGGGCFYDRRCYTRRMCTSSVRMQKEVRSYREMR